MKELVLGGALVAALTLPAAWRQGTEAKPLKIATVNTTQVRKSSKWAAQLLLAINQEGQANLQKLKALDDELNTKQKDLSLWTPGSEQHDRLKLELGLLNSRIENQAKMYQSWHDRRQAEALLAIYNEIEKQVQAIAAQEGIDLVLKETEAPKEASAVQQLLRIQSLSIVYSASRLDLTDQVTRRIDAERAKGPANADTGKKPEGGSGKDPDR